MKKRKQMQEGIESNDETMSQLEVVVDEVYDKIEKHSPQRIDGITRELYELPPFVAKKTWTELGEAIKQAERPTIVSIPGNHWISLRCDGTGFSKFTRSMRRLGIFQEGFSKDFADIMIDCCRTLLTKMDGGACAYTQSDEITVLIKPANVTNGAQQPHTYNGRVAKLNSLAASIVTARFNYRLQELFRQKQVDYDPDIHLVTFDCRVGVYETQKSAVSLLLWRAYDSGVNGVQDAVFHCKGKIDGAGQAMKLTIDKKLQWLAQHGKLPLQPHQKDGTYLVRRKVKVEAVNPITNETVLCLRSRIQQVEGNLLSLCKHDALFPPNETL